jgi:FixJ family two-component response regulator
VRMPGLSGLQALASLRSAEWSTPFILITAFRDPDTCELAASYGAACVLAKPFELAELASVIVAASAAGGPGP